MTKQARYVNLLLYVVVYKYMQSFYCFNILNMQNTINALNATNMQSPFMNKICGEINEE